MATIGFIGLGNMGGPMAANLVKSQHQVTGYDVVTAPVGNLEQQGGKPAATVAEAAAAGDIVITMLPAGPQVRQVYLGPDGIIAKAKKGALLIDCSTIDVETARAVAAAAAEAGLQMLDAPVSGGVMGAQGGTLTFMVGGSEAAFRKGRPILENMGRTIVHAGPSGNGQIAKICNNMILACSMIATCEGFALAEKLGLPVQTLFDICSTSTSQNWAMNNYCPMPGPVPAAPSNRGYAAGFTAANMLKDLRLSQQAAGTAAAATPLGAAAANLYQLFVDGGNGALDFSGIMQMIRRQQE
ncbi:MAG: 3-hydroxyisobutyrate dehydrogenase [Alphaproteobacteria bacterium]|nr:3-hydroxyisobutyrate dehydrogenase [Alphaproteobacteria bacterium]MBV9555077.1 3-hydroxyisobutyrate dehydrogenase [Alphaproteobacteria bacterium]